MLSAGNDLIMRAQALGNCDDPFDPFARKVGVYFFLMGLLGVVCDSETCDSICKAEYGGAVALGFCDTVKAPNYGCICRHPCE